MSEAHGNELNVLTSYRLNDFKKKAAFTLAEGATQRICTRTERSEFVPASKTTLLRAVHNPRHVDMSANIHRVAFTLAEVLITLGIIGIVAAMTIPTLISKFQEKSLESQFKKTYSLLNQALQLTNYENGVEYKCYSKTKDFENSDYYEYSQCKEFQEAFFKNLKYLKYDVVNQTTVDYKTKEEVLAEGGGITNPSCSFKYLVADTYKYYLPDGSIVYANPRNSDTGGIFMIVDITGDKGPNKWGYDVFQLSPTKRKNGSVRINEAICAIWEKGGKRTQNILNNIDEVSDDWFAD